jgi:predicted RecA/RadA family phage recombinase
VSAEKAESTDVSSPGGWKTEIHGYFRAPMTLGISSRPNPDEVGRINPDTKEKVPDGPNYTQISYGPNRIVDWSYYSFAYTGVQEQDWAELFIHQKKKHVDAVIGWLGYWYGAAGYRNPDASWWPGMAYLTLDNDIQLGDMKSNASLTVGSFWPKFGYAEKYDTYTLGRFRMLGEQATLTLPLSEDLNVKLYQGFGTNRDGAYNYDMQKNPLYSGKTGVDVIVYGHAQLTYKKIVDLGLHYNYTFTRDPRLTAEASVNDGKSYGQAAKAHVAVAGAELTLRIPHGGRLWLSPSYISVVNGWALAGGGGIEVMHSQNGFGLAQNYLAWTNDAKASTGSGTMVNVGALYTIALSDVLSGSSGMDAKLSLFGLATRAKLDLPQLASGAQALINQDHITQIKYGLDLSVFPQSWYSLMVRADQVVYNYDHAGYIFASLMGRLSLYSNYLSGECIYLQYAHYIYGDKMVLGGTWPWGTNLVAGGTEIQAIGVYSQAKPDEDVFTLQAQVRF